MQQQVADALHSSTQLAIQGGNSRAFYGREVVGEPFQVGGYQGVVDYHPTELVVTAKAGTPLAELEEGLAENNQMLGFEPPSESGHSTLGGAIATGLSGPGRPYSGSAQDFVLGVKILAGDGTVMNFGGQVIKNVAGFDVSRLMVGANGCLGVLLEVSLKVIPRPAFEMTLCLEYGKADDAVMRMNELAGKPLPVTAASWFDGVMRIRLSGSESGVKSAQSRIGGDEDQHGAPHWRSIRDQSHPFFQRDDLITRISVKPSQAVYDDVPVLVDWGGAMRWYCGDAAASALEMAAASQGGHHDGNVSQYRNGDRRGEVFVKPDSAIMKFHHRLKDAFDPGRIFNPGRMYAEL